jgi:hypothetical protein
VGEQVGLVAELSRVVSSCAALMTATLTAGQFGRNTDRDESIVAAIGEAGRYRLPVEN